MTEDIAEIQAGKEKAKAEMLDILNKTLGIALRHGRLNAMSLVDQSFVAQLLKGTDTSLSTWPQDDREKKITELFKSSLDILSAYELIRRGSDNNAFGILSNTSMSIEGLLHAYQGAFSVIYPEKHPFISERWHSDKDASRKQGLVFGVQAILSDLTEALRRGTTNQNLQTVDFAELMFIIHGVLFNANSNAASISGQVEEIDLMTAAISSYLGSITGQKNLALIVQQHGLDRLNFWRELITGKKIED